VSDAEDIAPLDSSVGKGETLDPETSAEKTLTEF
jgi:hypothetical protein